MSTKQHTLANKMVMVGEQISDVESVAFVFLLPAGSSRLPVGCCGGSNIISDWIFRGAGGMNSVELSDALETLGIHHSNNVSSSHIAIGGAFEASNLDKALKLFSDIISRPTLSDEQFELAKQVVIESILGIDDDPRQKVMLKLKELFYPDPLGRSTAGDINEIKTLTASKTRELANEYFNFSEAIFATAGKLDFEQIAQCLEKNLDNKTASPLKTSEITESQNHYTHIPNDGAQVHIGLMTKTVGPDDADYYNARAAVSILSGGMSARLFTEVREKRGLCYAIGASYHCLKEAAGIACYAGTMPQKSQETLDVIKNEFNRLSDGIEQDELDRAKAGLKSSLIMSSESTCARAGGIASDYYMLGKVRDIDEIKRQIDATTVESVTDFLKRNRFEDFTIVTIGPKEVKV